MGVGEGGGEGGCVGVWGSHLDRAEGKRRVELLCLLLALLHGRAHALHHARLE
jgi:hypothetical protein